MEDEVEDVVFGAKPVPGVEDDVVGAIVGDVVEVLVAEAALDGCILLVEVGDEVHEVVIDVVGHGGLSRGAVTAWILGERCQRQDTRECRPRRS